MKQPKYIYILECIFSNKDDLSLNINDIITMTGFDINELVSESVDFLKSEFLSDMNLDIDSFSQDEYDKYMDSIYYHIRIKKMSLNPILFNTTSELMEYINKEIKKQTTNTLYDFLMSVSYCELYKYDHNGISISSNPIVYDDYEFVGYSVDFSEDSCSRGEYKYFLGNIDNSNDKNNYKTKNIPVRQANLTGNFLD